MQLFIIKNQLKNVQDMNLLSYKCAQLMFVHATFFPMEFKQLVDLHH